MVSADGRDGDDRVFADLVEDDLRVVCRALVLRCVFFLLGAIKVVR